MSQRSISIGLPFALVLGAVACGMAGRTARAADAPGRVAPASCTRDEGPGRPHGEDRMHGPHAAASDCVRGPAVGHGRAGGGSCGCGPGARCFGTACGDRPCGPCGPGACGPRCCVPPCHRGIFDDCCVVPRCDVYEKRYFLRSQGKSWHSTWYDPAEGRPIALVVPPTAEFQSQYGWGVPSSRVAPIYHQFRRPYPGPGAMGGTGGGFLPTPSQPSDTVQFGVNAVRGPWGAY